MNDTMRKFGYPDTRIADYESWTVLLRPQQATLGALVLACREPVQAFGSVSAAGCAELSQACGDIERVLDNAFRFDKINYLMLMMIDPDVHFHVLPRYAENRRFGALTFEDPGWPGPPRLDHATEVDATAFQELLASLRDAW